MSDHIGNKGMKRWIELLLGLFKYKEDLMEELNLTKEELKIILKGDEDVDLTGIEIRLDKIDAGINEINKKIGHTIELLEGLISDGVTCNNCNCTSNGDIDPEPSGPFSDPTPYTDFKYELNEDSQTITLQRYNGSDEEIIIPSRYIVDGTSYAVQLGDNPSRGLYQNSWGLFGGKSSITSVIVEDGTKMISGDSMFFECTKLVKVDLSNVDASGAGILSSMFDTCSNLSDVNLTNFNTSGATKMFKMFVRCESLETLDLSSIDTNVCIDTSYMFYGCHKLSNIKFGEKFTCKKVTTMKDMFYSCIALVSLDLSTFNTTSITNTTEMFSSCRQLTDLKLGSNFVTKTDRTMDTMFGYCSKLVELDLTSFDTSAVTSMIGMFNGCTELSSILVTSGKWVTSQANTLSMFNDCKTDHVTEVPA